MNVNEYLFIWKRFRVVSVGEVKIRWKEITPHLICADGFEMSVQASRCSYCVPDVDDSDWYEAVEVMCKEDPAFEPFECGGVYGQVPVDIVDQVIDRHGGIAGPFPPNPSEVVESR